MSSTAGLLKEDTDTAINIRVGTPFSIIVVIKSLARKILGADAVQIVPMISGHICRQILIDLWSIRIRSTRHTWLEKKVEFDPIS